MKKSILFALLLLFCLPAFAQKDKVTSQEKKREILEFKMKYLADQMELKDDLRKQFFEVYTQMENERRAVFRKMKDAEKRISETKNASDADYDKAGKEIAEYKKQMADIEKKYDERFSKFLSSKQIYIMKGAEEKFNQKMRVCRDQKREEKKPKK